MGVPEQARVSLLIVYLTWSKGTGSDQLYRNAVLMDAYVHKRHPTS